MILSDKEIESVSKLEPFKRYQYFIKKVADTETLFCLKNKEVWAIAEVENYRLFSFWCAKQFAEKERIGRWQYYEVIEISLSYFNNELIPLIRKENYLINIFSVNGKTGFVVDLEEFLSDLDLELAKYG